MQLTNSWLRKLTKVFVAGAAGATTLMFLAVAMISLSDRSNANPAMARMTGRTCAECHVPAQEPRLNAFGQAFKSCGYRECNAPPAARRPAPMPQFGGGGGTCNRFVCNSHNVCHFRIRFANGRSRELTIRRGESYNVRDVHANDRWCFIEPNGVCELKHMNLHSC